MDKDKEHALSLDEAITIIDAHISHRWESLYLQEAWARIKEEINERKNNN